MTINRILDEIEKLEEIHQRSVTDITYKLERLKNLLVQNPKLPTKAKVKQMAEEAGQKRRQRILKPQS